MSETKGDYDGQYLFVNDKANARIAVVNLTDFATKQIIANPLVASDHGGAFVTPNTDYVIETSQYPAPLGREYTPLSDSQDLADAGKLVSDGWAFIGSWNTEMATGGTLRHTYFEGELVSRDVGTQGGEVPGAPVPLARARSNASTSRASLTWA